MPDHGYAMSRWKLIAVLLAAVCLALPAAAHAQRAAGGRSAGTVAPRGAGGGRPVVVAPGRVGVYGYRPYYYPYRFYRPGISFGFAFGYPYYYGYGWGYPYPYYYPYGYGYGYP